MRNDKVTSRMLLANSERIKKNRSQKKLLSKGKIFNERLSLEIPLEGLTSVSGGSHILMLFCCLSMSNYNDNDLIIILHSKWMAVSLKLDIEQQDKTCLWRDEEGKKKFSGEEQN